MKNPECFQDENKSSHRYIILNKTCSLQPLFLQSITYVEISETFGNCFIFSVLHVFSFEHSKRFTIFSNIYELNEFSPFTYPLALVHFLRTLLLESVKGANLLQSTLSSRVGGFLSTRNSHKFIALNFETFEKEL